VRKRRGLIRSWHNRQRCILCDVNSEVPFRCIAPGGINLSSSSSSSIVEAVEAGTPLQVAGADGSSEACAVVVGKHNQNMKIFTSWHAGADVDGRWRQSHVPLGVEVQNSTGTPLLDTVKWVNGLSFSKQCEQTPVIFKWPRIWVENPYR